MRLPILTSTVLASLLLAGSGCGRARTEAAPPDVPPVHVERVTPIPTAPEARATATLEPVHRVVLTPRVPGVVIEVRFALGDRVRAGDILVRVEPAEGESAAEAASAAVAQANHAVAVATRERDRAKRLYRAGAAPRAMLDEAEAALVSARLVRRQATTQRRAAKRGLSEADLRAPFDGVIAERHVDVGAVVAPGAPVAILVDDSYLVARTLLDPQQAMDLEAGAPADVHVYARPDEHFHGEVAHVGGAIDPLSRRLPAEVRIDNTDHRLVAGVLARFTIQTGPPLPTLRVPTQALLERAGRMYVYVLEGQEAHRREVVLGDVRQGQGAVLSGLTQGEEIVVAGQARLTDGSQVNVVPSSLSQADVSAREGNPPEAVSQ